MTYPDTISVTRATETGAEDEFGQKTADTPTTLYTGRCDIQDMPWRTVTEVTGDRDPDAYATVFLPRTTNVGTVRTGDGVTATDRLGNSRTGRVVSQDMLNLALTIRFSAPST